MSVSEEEEPTTRATKKQKTTVSEADVKPSIALHLIRHAESGNNEVYRNARYIYRGGTPDFDDVGWNKYVEHHRKADPLLSKKGCKQAQALATYMVPHLQNQASNPVRIITSPMRRTLETIRPTLELLQKSTTATTQQQPKVQITVCAFYHESEGCHIKDKAGKS
jgi:broad specificity phosphatase PhoE